MTSPLYRRNPEGTQLGQRILAAAAELYAGHGLEWLTFRKLASRIDSTEASIYRYFHNKYQLLCYLVCKNWRSVCQELERWNRELPTVQRRSQLMLTLFPAPGQTAFDEHLRSLIPLFWLWYQARTEEDQAYSEPVIQQFAEVVEQTALALNGTPESAVQLAFMLCQSAGCLPLFEQLPDFDVLAYRQLWEKLLNAAEQPIVNDQPNAAEQANPNEHPNEHPLEDLASNIATTLATSIGSGMTTFLTTGLPAAAPGRRRLAAEASEVKAREDIKAKAGIETALEADVEIAIEADIEQGAADAGKRDYLPATVSALSSHGGFRTVITHVMVRKLSGYNLLELRDFMALPPAEQQSLLDDDRIHFISGEGQPVEKAAALGQLFPRS
ncbi:MAG: TetR/AcrR family transcriptional regulator [Candidatus Sericytochromatia bacterium]